MSRASRLKATSKRNKWHKPNGNKQYSDHGWNVLDGNGERPFHKAYAKRRAKIHALRKLRERLATS